MAINWNKPVVTADGVEPLLSPPNIWGNRVGYIEQRPLEWVESGMCYFVEGLRCSKYDLRNKPETVKVWLKLGRSGDGLIRGTVSPYGSIGYLGNEWLHGPIEIPIPEGK